MLRRRLLIEWFAIAALCTALVVALLTTNATSRLDNAAYDLLVGLRAPPPSGRILIVAIDDPSIAAIGRWPWPRDVHAAAINRIAAAKPAVISYDVLFTEPSSRGGDAALARAVAKAPTVLPVLAQAPGLDGRAIEITLPIAPIRAAAAAIGHVALPHETDGTARGALLALDDGHRVWPHVMEASYRLAFHHPSPAWTRAAAPPTAPVSVPYQPFAGGFRTLSFADILNGSVSPALLRDRIVLVGATAGGLGDRYTVPTRGGVAIPGIDIQANLLNALIADRLVKTVSPGWRIAAGLVPSLILLLAFWWLAPSRALIASLAMIAAMMAIPALLLLVAGLWLPPAPTLFGLLLVYPLWGWRRLQAMDSAMARELTLFDREDPRPIAPAPLLDPVGGHAAALSNSIARLRDLRRLIADTVDGVADPLVVTTMDDRLLLANAPAKVLLGDFGGGTLRNQLALVAGTAIEGSLPDELALPDGRAFSPRRTPLADGEGRQRGWIILLADISAIRRAERDREEALEFLSHDMRSPQSSIVTLIDGAGPAPLAPDRAARIRGYARRTLVLADDFVQLARLNTARFNPEETDLADALAEAADGVWAPASARGVRTVVTTPEEPACVMGEHDALTRAFLNLLDNAVKFSPDGGTVRCAIIADTGGYRVSIEDEGPGMPPDRMAVLFDRFGPIVRRGGQGSGLGLAYVRAAVARHGGTVACEAVLPHGTRFLVGLTRLP